MYLLMSKIVNSSQKATTDTLRVSTAVVL